MALSLVEDSRIEILDTLRPEEDEGVIVRRLHRMVEAGTRHPVRVAYERDASIDYNFKEGEHWTPAELADLRERGQPPIKRNEIKPHVDRIVGQFIQTRQTATFLGRNTPQDDQCPQVLQDIQRQVDQQNGWEFEEQEIGDDGVTGGVGWARIDIRENELGQKTIYEQSENPFEIYSDPFSRRFDPNRDARYMFCAKWMDMEDAIALGPDKEQQIRQIMGGHSYGLRFSSSVDSKLQNDEIALYYDPQRERIRPFEVWYKRKVRAWNVIQNDKIITFPVPLDHKQANDVARQLKNSYLEEKITERMYVGIFVAGILIHHDQSPHRHNLFPWVPFYCGRKKNGQPLSLVRQLVPINEAINKRESKALAMLNNRRIIYEETAIKDPAKAQEENAKPDGLIEVADGAIAGNRVTFGENTDIGQGNLALLQEDKDAMRRVSGFGEESLGLNSQVRSGKGIQAKQLMTDMIVAPLHNNLRRFRHLKAKLQFEYIKQYYDADMTFMVTDDPNAARYVQVTRDHMTAIKERIYDIIINDDQDFRTVREQQTTELLNVMPQLAALGPVYAKIGLMMSNVRNKEGFAKMLDEANQPPPPPPPKINLSMVWTELEPEEKAYIAMTALNAPELAQAILADMKDPAFKQKIKAGLASTEIKEGTKAMVEHGKQDQNALAIAMDGLLRSKELTSGNTNPAQPTA